MKITTKHGLKVGLKIRIIVSQISQFLTDEITIKKSAKKILFHG
jgi:hypothetical protein